MPLALTARAPGASRRESHPAPEAFAASASKASHERRRAYRGIVTVSQRSGMSKTYDLTRRQFGWKRLPRGAMEREGLAYPLDRALRAQGIVSHDSVETWLIPRGRRACKQQIEHALHRFARFQLGR